MQNNPWLDMAKSACDHAGITPETIDIIATWDQLYCANAVYCINGQLYLKLFGPTARHQFYIERSVLSLLCDHPLIKVPRIVTADEHALKAAPYLIMTAMAGSTAEALWDDLPRTVQLSLAHEIGVITAAVHALPQDDLARVEQQVGGRREWVTTLMPTIIDTVESHEIFTREQREALTAFIRDEAPRLIDDSLRLTHSDLAHNHIYLTGEGDQCSVAGIIDWGEAMLGPAEWDVIFLWFWTFSRDREAMKICLDALYPDGQRPDHFARRCLAAALYTVSMRLLWPEFIEHLQKPVQHSIVREMTAFFFPPDIFGPPD